MKFCDACEGKGMVWLRPKPLATSIFMAFNKGQLLPWLPAYCNKCRGKSAITNTTKEGDSNGRN